MIDIIVSTKELHQRAQHIFNGSLAWKNVTSLYNFPQKIVKKKVNLKKRLYTTAIIQPRNPAKHLEPLRKKLYP